MKVGDLVRVRSNVHRTRSVGELGVIREILHIKYAEVLIFSKGKRSQYHIGHLEVISESR